MCVTLWPLCREMYHAAEPLRSPKSRVAMYLVGQEVWRAGLLLPRWQRFWTGKPELCIHVWRACVVASAYTDVMRHASNQAVHCRVCMPQHMTQSQLHDCSITDNRSSVICIHKHAHVSHMGLWPLFDLLLSKRCILHQHQCQHGQQEQCRDALALWQFSEWRNSQLINASKNIAGQCSSWALPHQPHFRDQGRGWGPVDHDAAHQHCLKGI